MSDPIEKREFSEEERKKDASNGDALKNGSFPIENEGDLKNAVHAVGRAKDIGAAKAHIISRAKSMGLTRLLPEDWISKEDRSPIDEIVDAADEGSDDEDQSFSVQTEIIKAFPQRKIDRRGREYPGKIDKQLDWTDSDEIQDTVHEFMINLQNVEKSADESGLSYRHARMIKSDEARIVECGQIDFPETWGDRVFPAGTWKIATRVYSPKLFSDIDGGTLRGCSVEGDAIHTKQPLQ